MRRAVLALVMLSLLALPALAAAETWQNVPLIDTNCVNEVKADPNTHDTACLLMCAKIGYGILASDGTWLTLEANGNEEALKAPTRENGIRVTVTGEREGDSVKVQTLKID